jgi:chromosome segregation ATPase
MEKLTKEQEKLLQDIKKSQEKLDGVMIAINRENSVLEEKTKEKKNIEKEIIVVSKQLEDLSSSLKSLNDAIYNAKTAFAKQEFELKDSIKTLQHDVKSLTDQKALLEKNIEEKRKEFVSIQDALFETKEKILKEDEKQEKEYAVKKQQYEKEIVSIKDTIDTLKKENSAVLEINSSLKKETQEIDQVLVEKQNQVSFLDKKFSSLENTVKEKQLDIEKSKIDLQDVFDAIATANSNLNTVKKELEVIATEKENFIKEKFALNELREALERKEEFIKNKYEQAGVKYS